MEFPQAPKAEVVYATDYEVVGIQNLLCSDGERRPAGLLDAHDVHDLFPNGLPKFESDKFWVQIAAWSYAEMRRVDLVGVAVHTPEDDWLFVQYQNGDGFELPDWTRPVAQDAYPLLVQLCPGK